MKTCAATIVAILLVAAFPSATAVKEELETGDKNNLRALYYTQKYKKNKKKKITNDYHTPPPTYHPPPDMCPDSIQKAIPHYGNKGGKCFRGAACQAQFSNDSNYSGYAAGTKQHAQMMYLKKQGVYEFFSESKLIILESLFGGKCTHPHAGMSGGMPPAGGVECFLQQCRNQGPNSFHFDYTISQNPYVYDIVSLCKCIVTGGADCRESCNCKMGSPAPPIGFHPFCDCYCQCCPH